MKNLEKKLQVGYGKCWFTRNVVYSGLNTIKHDIAALLYLEK